jgi:3-deoxy-D-manno-octulosonate 8-phosphate phosphatase (KDO 8-P phosphatase)
LRAGLRSEDWGCEKAFAFAASPLHFEASPLHCLVFAHVHQPSGLSPKIMSSSHLDDLPADIRERAARIRLAVFDVDGVLTDGKLWYTADDHELKAFHVHDGLGLKRLLANGIEVAIITARVSHVVTERMAELGVAHVYQDQKNKHACLEQLLHALRLSADQVAYTGDDLPDLVAMQAVGLSIAVADAHAWVRERAHWRTRLGGGAGAAREVCDLILAAQGKAEAELSAFLR